MSGFLGETIVGAFCGPSGNAGPSPTSAPARSSRLESHPAWMDGTRRWETAETDRLNEAHWQWAQDESLNAWLSSQLSTLRARSTYEAKNNGVILGMLATHADDIVGPDGPTLQVQSEDDAYNTALEQVWQDWFYAPTHLANRSGAAMLKLWIKSLWKCGRFTAAMLTDRNVAGPVQMRLRPIHPRRLGTPAELAGNPRVFMGVEYDFDGRPIRYYIARQEGIGTGNTNLSLQYEPWPADLVIDEYIFEEEDQGAGVPWLAPGLQVAADLRDYDDQVQDAARQMADQACLLYTTSPDVPVWQAPESTTMQRRTAKMAPPGWQPWQYTSSQPPVQYPDYRAERQLELGRPAQMPRLLVRLDASKHSWASARLDIDTWRRAGSCFQTWLSGSEKSCGTLNRLVDEVAREARFSVRALRNRPAVVRYSWTWPQLDPVEPDKQAKAEAQALESRTRSLTEILACRKKTLPQHLEELRREEEAFDTAEVAKPAWMLGAAGAALIVSGKMPGEGDGDSKADTSVEDEADV